MIFSNHDNLFVKNFWGREIWYVTALELMDDDLREELHEKNAPCTPQEFFDAYTYAHQYKFNETWVLATREAGW